MNAKRWLVACLAPVAVVAFGVCLATLPHWRSGDPVWVANYDELAFYMPVAATAYRNHPASLADPATGGPTYYQPLPTVPGILVAKALGLGPWHIGLVWRILGGLGIAVGWYVLLRLRFAPFPAAIAACLLMADPGVLNGQLGYTLGKTWVRPLPPTTDTEASANKLPPQWRILNPSVTWPWWLAFFAATTRAVAVPNRGRIFIAGVACGLLFHVYFYFWTTAVAGLLLAAVLDRQRWRVYAGILTVGLGIGSPALIAATQFRAEHGSDWLLRTDKFLPVGRFDELLIPRVSVLILLATWAWVYWRGREWVWLASIATAALLLLNQTAVTGLQIENFHWNLALGPALSFLVILLVSDTWGRMPQRLARLGPALATVFICTVAAGNLVHTFRVVDATTENPHVQPMVIAFRSQTAGLNVPTHGTVAGDPDFQYAAAVEFDLRPLSGYTAVLSPMTDAELDTRIALNSFLLGRSREQFRDDETAVLRATRWGLEARSAEARTAKLAVRLAAWDAVTQNPVDIVERFDVRVLARLSGSPEPAPLGWVLAQSGPRWDVWTRPR